MSPQMQQAIQLLQLPILELSQKIEQELAQNPVLEEVSREEVSQEILHEQQKTDKTKEEEEVKFQKEFDVLRKIDDEWREYFQQTSPYHKYTQEDQEKRAFLESSITQSETLQEHLLHQMTLAASNDEEKKLGELIIGNIDSDGFLRISVEELSMMSDKDVDEVKKVLKIIQTFDPNGIGGSTLKESLLIQLENKGKKDSLAYKILADYFELVGKKKYQEIAKALRVKVQDVQDAVKNIVRLNLRPGALFSQAQTQYIVPDVTLRKDDDNFEVIINDERIPHLRISNFYRRMMMQNGLSPEVRDYIKEKIHSGRWLIKNIHQRQETLYNIAREIVKAQKNFLLTGMGNLEPLTMHQIAEAVNLHESTISRAISNKYIDTPHGIFPLKFFFTTAIGTTDGKEVSSHKVKHLLKELITAEDPKKPLSDEALVKMINAKGMKIARRTVAKYRKELNILPSHLRKQY